MSAFWIVAAAVAGLVVLLAVVSFLRMGWRLLRGDEQMEPGGSYGTLFRRDQKTTPKKG